MDPAAPAAPPAPVPDGGAAPVVPDGARVGLWRRIGLQTQLLAILTVLLLVALSLTSFVVQRALSGQLHQQVSSDLVTAANPESISAMMRSSAPGALDPDGDRRAPTDYVVAIQVDGTDIAVLFPRNPGPRGQTTLLPADIPSLTSAQAAEKRGTYVITTATGAHYLATSLPVRTRTGLSAAATVLRDLSPTERTLEQVRLMFLAVGLLVLCGSALLGWLAIRRAFAPLVQMERTAEAIAAGDLSRRVPPAPPNTEVGRLTASLNAMLSHIESAFRAREASETRTKRFAADASHELRTPLASIRGYAELYRQGAVPSTEVPQAMRRIEDEAKRMGGLVEDLLLLARLDEQRPMRSVPVDLLVIAGDAVHDAKALDPERPVRLVGLNGSGPSPAPVAGDDDRLRQVVANLVANAVKHTPSGTPIEVAVGRDDAHGVIEVRDHGRGLSPDQADRVFERFYRADASRQRGRGGGAGLGLSIVEAVVTAHRGRVEVAETPGGGATFRVSLPAATDTASASASATDTGTDTGTDTDTDTPS